MLELTAADELVALENKSVAAERARGHSRGLEEDQPEGAATETHNATREQEHKV